MSDRDIPHAVTHGHDLPPHVPQHDVDGTFGFPRRDRDSDEYQVSPHALRIRSSSVDDAMMHAHLDVLHSEERYPDNGFYPLPPGGWWGQFIRVVENRWAGVLINARDFPEDLDAVHGDWRDERSAETDGDEDDCGREEGQSGLEVFA